MITELEIVLPDKPDPLATALVPELGAESALKIRTVFGVMFDEVEKWRTKVSSIIVTSEDQTTEMEVARITRLALKKIRVSADHKRKELKADSDRYGKACQAAYNLLEFQIVPLEKHLQDQEDYVERLKQKRILETKEMRIAELTPYAIDLTYVDLGNMPEASYMQYLASTRMAHDAKLAAAKKKAEEDLAEVERQKKVEAENVRLKAVAEAQAKELRESALKADAETKRIHEAHAGEQARLKKASDDAAEIQRREIADIEAKAAADRARMVVEQEAERKRLKAVAEANQEKMAVQAKALEEQAKVERDKRLASEAEARDKKAKEDSLAAEKAAQEAEAKRKAESAPDKEKMLAYADALEDAISPELTTDNGKLLFQSTTKALFEFTAKIRQRAEQFL